MTADDEKGNLKSFQKSREGGERMSLQVPDYIRTLIPYVPGKPIEETQRQYGLKKVIKLASNENPLGPSPLAKKAIQAQLKELHRYPDSGGFHLKQALSKNLKVSPESLILGNGSNEIIDQVVRTFCVPGDAIASHRGAFIAYKICAQIHGVKVEEASINDEMKVDLGELSQLIRKNDRIKVVFLANPNNPTGTYHNTEEFRAFFQDLKTIRGGAVVLVLDYAYWEYVTASDLPNALEFINDYPHLLVVRTFSKIYGLAGMRMGYGVSSPELIAHLEKVRQPFNVSSLALAGAQAALADRAFVKKSRQLNAQGMRFWEKQLKRMGIPFWKSQCNFLLADVQKGLGKSGVEVYQSSLEKGVIFRPVANYGFPHALRISIGTAKENERAVQVLDPKRGAERKRK
jgi:histidinol-phosphate aminotransferase